MTPTGSPTLRDEWRSTAARPVPAGRFDRWARAQVLARAAGIREGRLTLIDGAERFEFGRAPRGESLSAAITVRDPRLWRHVVLGGTVGVGTAYLEGCWDCDDLPSLVRMFVRNRDAMFALERGWARWSGAILRGLACLRGNTRPGSRRNIAAHYDLGNEFFAAFLDETMMYSCAVFEPEDLPLAEASTLKNERICRKLALGPQDRLLEIGTGWGGFAIHAARRYGCRVTTTTISERQFEYAAERVNREGLSDRVTVLRDDYRDLKGRYDKLVSIEMIEAIGAAQYPTFFRRCTDLLEPHGTMLLQTITIADREFEQHARSVDFIKRYIFPGSCLPSVTALCAAMTRAGDLQLVHLEDLTRHYVTTLRRWRERFRANLDRVRALGFGESFVRLWEYYFGYCEGSFQERYTGDVQMLLARPLARPPV